MPASPIPSIPMYTVLSSTYSNFKAGWAAGKGYKVVGTLETAAESIASMAVAATSAYTKASTLHELDVKIRPNVLRADCAVSPYIEKSAKFASDGSKQMSPVVKVLRKVVPVATAGALYSIFIAIFSKNMSTVGRFMLIKESPETRVE